MKVREFISLLQSCDPEADVATQHQEWYTAPSIADVFYDPDNPMHNSHWFTVTNEFGPNDISVENGKVLISLKEKDK